MHEVYKKIVKLMQDNPAVLEDYQFTKRVDYLLEIADEQEKSFLTNWYKTIRKDLIATQLNIQALGINDEPDLVEESRHGFGSAPIRAEGQAVTWGWKNIKDPNATVKLQTKERYKV